MAVIRDLLSYRLHTVANLLSRGAELRYRREFGVSLWEWRTIALLGAVTEPLSLNHLAHAAGRFDNPDFPGWGRSATDANGIYSFRTIRPGAAAGRAPHINFLVLYSGLMRQLQTVMFFENGNDPVLNAVQPASLRERLIAKRQGNTYVFDIRLRGEGETPFFGD